MKRPGSGIRGWGLGLLVLTLTSAPAALEAQNLVTRTGTRKLSGQKDLAVHVEFAAGQFVMGRDLSGALYRTRITYNEERFRPLLDFDTEANELHVGVKGLEGRRNAGNDLGGQRVELLLSPTVPTSINLEFGAAQADLDFGGLNLVRADVKTGASQTSVRFSQPTVGTCEELIFHVGAAEFKAEQLGNARCHDLEFKGGAGDLTLDFTGDWGPLTNMTADVGVGVSHLMLRLPRNVGVEVEMNQFLAGFDKTGFVRRGRAYYSPNYDTAKTRLHLDITAALGQVEVAWR